MRDADATIADPLEKDLAEAYGGSKEAALRFFEALLKGGLYAPERYQAQPLSNAPTYPNDFINILGVQDKERVVVPVFSRKEYIEQWCGAELAVKELSGTELFKLLPADWWIVVNPGREVEKELSPWELDQLRGGAAGIAAVLDEIFAVEMTESSSVQPPAEDEYIPLRRALLSTAAELTEISRLYLLKERGKDIDENEVHQVLIGVEAPGLNYDELESLNEKVKAVAGPCQIGGDPVKVLTGAAVDGGVALGVFGKTEPIYVKARGCRKLLKWLVGRS